MSPARAPLRAVTPGSVKVLMLVEAGVIGFLGFWLANEYFYNAYFRTYLGLAWIGNAAAYSSIIGVAIGLAGSAVAATLYRNLRNAKRRLETIATPRIKGAVDKLLSGLPTLDDQLSVSKMKQSTAPIPVGPLSLETSKTAGVPDPNAVKKE
jgi:hypothetical protein